MFIAISCIVLVAIAASIVSYIVLKSPYSSPYFTRSIDISGKRKPDIEDLVDQYLIDCGMRDVEKERARVAAWKAECKKEIAKSPFCGRREKQFEAVVDDDHAYRFTAFRMQTRYQQRNYQRTAYKVRNEIGTYSCNYAYLASRNALLASINYETTLKKYNSQEQRRLLTPKLRQEIMERDNYTCQICGKYMPDKVGLQIDHIIPIAKGGKTVPSNLQVLCSRCNGSKHDKLEV